MKKTYQTPSVNVTFVGTTQMMALSLDKVDTGGNEVLVHQEQAWDIWSEEERKEQDELYYDEYEDEYYY